MFCFFAGDDLELFDNSIKRLCSYLSGSEEEQDDIKNDEDDEILNNDVRRRMNNKKIRTFRRKLSSSNDIDDKNNLNSALEMSTVDHFNGEKLFLPRGTTAERRLLPQGRKKNCVMCFLIN